MTTNVYLLAARTFLFGIAALALLAWGIVWLALWVRGIEGGWWPMLFFSAENWPDSIIKLVGEFGPVGDFVGGFLNPLFSLCAFIALFFSLRIQRESVAQQLDQENFFTLLANRESAVANLELRLADHVITGRAVIREIIKHIDTEASAKVTNGRVLGISPELKAGQNLKYTLQLKRRVEVYTILYNGQPFDLQNLRQAEIILNFQNRFQIESLEDLLGHIFRSTYQVLKFVHSCKSFDEHKRRDLINYLRAQMSESEFIAFGLSGLTQIGKKSRAASIAFDLFEDRLGGTYRWARSMRSFFNQTAPSNIELCFLNDYTPTHSPRSARSAGRARRIALNVKMKQIKRYLQRAKSLNA